MWAAVTDDQATLSIGAIAIQPGNTDPAKTVILAATGEANNSGDSYFGLGILRSANAGSTWTLIPGANAGALSFSGLGGTRMAFSTANGQTNAVVAAMATSSEGLVDGIGHRRHHARSLYFARCGTDLDLQRAGRSWRRYRCDVSNVGRLPRCRWTVLRCGALPRVLFFPRRHALDASRGPARWSAVEHSGMSSPIDLEQLRLPDLSRRDHGGPESQRDVCLVHFSHLDRQSSGWRHVAERERGRIVDCDLRQRHHELRRLRWLRCATRRLQSGTAGAFRTEPQRTYTRARSISISAASPRRIPRARPPHS